jgi:hypothetical protein
MGRLNFIVIIIIIILQTIFHVYAGYFGIGTLKLDAIPNTEGQW